MSIRRSSFFIIGMMLLVIMVLSATLATFAQGELTGQTISNLNVRSGPGIAYVHIATIPFRTPVVIESRNTIGDWIVVRTGDGRAHGWVAARYVHFPPGLTLESLPITDAAIFIESGIATVGSTGAVQVPQITGILSATFPDVQIAWADDHLTHHEMIQRLEETPILHNMGNATMQLLLQRGMALGNSPHRFTVLGDSVTAAQPFLEGYSRSDVYDLGPYAPLSATIAWFNEPFPTGAPNSFSHAVESHASRVGFTSGALFDPLWMNPEVCTNAPIFCEYEMNRPAIAIIYFHSQDHALSDVAFYRHHMTQIVYATLEMGVIPVLTTGTLETHRDFGKSVIYNNIVLDLAAAYNLPVINFWRAAQSLENVGIDPDNPVHLSQSHELSDNFSFNGQERLYGTTLRNLVTLQALEMLKNNVLAPMAGG